MPRKRLKYVHKYRTRHGEEIYYYRRGQSGRVRLPDTYGTEEFMAAYAVAAVGGRPDIPDIGIFDRRTARIESALAGAMEGCRSRAKNRGRGFELTIEWLSALAKKQNYRCAVTGIPIDLRNRSRRGSRNPLAPSIDRIDCKGGYTKDNVRIVALAVNIMLADWGEGVLELVATAYLNKMGTSMCQPPTTACQPQKRSHEFRSLQ